MFQELNRNKAYCTENIEEKSIENNCENIIDEDMWYDIDQFQLDHLNEVLQRLSEGTLDDEIWGKLIIMEKTKRIAKAYLRKTTIIVDGGDEEFDGMTIGFNYFSNPDRDHQTSELRKKIGDGVIIKMDSQGNIKAMARGAAPVIVQNWKNNKKHCIAEKLLRLQGKLITKRGIDMNDDDRIFKVFDMKKFKISIERDCFETEEDVKNLLLKTCLRIALVKDGQPDDPMETPCWFMLINLVALDMIKTKMPHIADLNCLYGELGCPSVIPSIKRSALKEQIESSSISCSNRRKSQSYYEILSDDSKKHHFKISSNYDNGRRKGKRNLSSSDDSEESNTEVNTKYNHNVINSRFLKPYSGSITDSSSGFASGTDKRSFSSTKRSSSDLTKSVEDLKINCNESKNLLNPGIKISGLRPKLDKTLFDPPYSSRKNNGLIRKRSSLQEIDRERRKEYRNSCNIDEIYNECNDNSIEIDNIIYTDKEKCLDETYNNNDYAEGLKIDNEGKDFDINEALKNVDESFNYLQNGDYYSDFFEVEENNCRENLLLIDKPNESTINNNDSDDTVSSQSPLPYSNNLLYLNRHWRVRKPITKYNNYLQTIDRVRSKVSKNNKNTNNGKSDVLFNRSETIKINSISNSSPLEIADISCQFFKSQEQECTMIVWKEWRCIRDKIYSNFKNPSISIVNVEYDFVKNTSLNSIRFGKGVPLYENEYDTSLCHYYEYTDASSLANHLRRFNEEQCLDKKIPKNWFKEKRQNILPSKNWIFNHNDNPSLAYKLQTPTTKKKIGRATSIKYQHPNQQEWIPRRRSTTVYLYPTYKKQERRPQYSRSPTAHLQQWEQIYQSTKNNQNSRETSRSQTDLSPHQRLKKKNSNQWKSTEHFPTLLLQSEHTSKKPVEMSVKLQVYRSRNSLTKSPIKEQQPITSRVNIKYFNNSLPKFSNESEPIYDNPPIKTSESQHQIRTVPNYITRTVQTAPQPIQPPTLDNHPAGAVPARANLHGKKQDTEHGRKGLPTKKSQESFKNNPNTPTRSIKSLFKEYESKTDRTGKIASTCQVSQQVIKSREKIFNTPQTNGRDKSLDTKTCQSIRETSNKVNKSLSPTISNASSTSSITTNGERNDLSNITNSSSTGNVLLFSKRNNINEKEEQSKRRNIHENTTNKWTNNEKKSGRRDGQLLHEGDTFKPKQSINTLINIFEESSISKNTTSCQRSINKWCGKNISEKLCPTEVSFNRESNDGRNESKWNNCEFKSIKRRNNLWEQGTICERILGESSSETSSYGVEECNREDEEIFVKLK
uniref:MH2 domain-containing protein n=1 Tax=Strongyloides stercoralis TaxID=6248 RepID=A0AAF5DB44_STRER